FWRPVWSKMTSQLDQPGAQIARFAADIFEQLNSPLETRSASEYPLSQGVP
ncbi:MAG: hypothetical protein JWL77_2726, partial [Chthonomonadaceae bacterium]|nr:hypothetical protein [Chthonomonadaceae bacterium]